MLQEITFFWVRYEKIDTKNEKILFIKFKYSKEKNLDVKNKLKFFVHSSLLSVFSLNSTSTYDSYLPWIFGKFAMTRSNNLEIQNDENSKWKLVKTRWNRKFGLGDLENDFLTSTTSEVAWWIFSKNMFLKSVDHAEKNEL